jgi:spore maturation protein CgeB
MVLELASDGLEVFGDDGWRGAGVAPAPPADYAAELPDVYRFSRINFNMTSVQMPTAVNQRVFDCPAAGGFLLTDAQADLDDLFDAPKETVRYHGVEEARDLIRHYASNDSGRTEIVRHARTRILAEHTYERRLQTMTRLLKDRYGSA